jgi:hypothetical protein
LLVGVLEVLVEQVAVAVAVAVEMEVGLLSRLPSL